MKRLPYFAQRNVFAWERPNIMRKHIYTGAMGNIWAHLISGIFFVFFGEAMGLTELEWGLMGGISSWLIAAQIFSARLAERTGKRKLIWFWFAMADRVLRLVGILLALWVWSAGGTVAPFVLIVSTSLASLFGTMGGPPWLAWLGEIIPEEEHGTFWGRRSKWIAAATIIAVLPAGFIMDRIAAEYRLATSVGVFVAATLVGVLDLILHGTIPEPFTPPVLTGKIWADLVVPLRDHRFRPWLAFNAVWTFGMTLGGALGTIYFVNQLGIRENFLGGTLVLTGATLLATFASGRATGRILDRFGARRVLFGGHLLWSLLPLFWLIATPRSALVVLAVASVFGGVGAEAALNAATKVITRTPPPEQRPRYVAVSSTVGSIAGGFGVILAGVLLDTITGHASPEFLAISGDGYRVLFVASFVLRVLSTVVLVPRIRDAAPPASSI